MLKISQRNRGWRIVAQRVLILAMLALLPGLLFAETIETQPFRGITHRHISQTEPLRWSYHIVLIDLSDPAIRFTATRDNGELPKETTPQTTRKFVKETGAQLGINANFFINDKKPQTKLLGIAVTEGEKISPWERNGFAWAVNISKDNKVTILQQAKEDKTGYDTLPEESLYTAVSGSTRLLKAGKNLQPEEGARHPRTGVGITANNHLMFCVVDGRQKYHSVGMTMRELAEVMREQGAVDAIALDGGGSSTLVIANPKPKVVNVPMPFELNTKPHMIPPGIERKNGNNLAVFAAPKE